MAKKIGIYAGSFDPIHSGHLAFAEAALHFGMDKVMFLAEPRPRRKQGVRALEHRTDMIELAISQQPKYGVIKLEQARFTPYETVPVLQQLFKGAELYLMLGDDVLSKLVNYIAGWPNIDYLASNMTFLVATRQHKTSEIEASLKTLQKITNTKFKYMIIDQGMPNISSRQARLALRRGKQPANLPKQVISYIAKYGLYSPSADSK